ncbi:helix-turn-helix transcriptional regulator [Salinibaculum rarum]|uniref:helix-turn-helix transcriptional regulator n=1 Tax=Salinibaculum rarum TaxID=3058903 RepID=UPI00265DB5AC|nr:MarR family transcriptional regulator [Salinibaculum sp. KK48]
MNRRRVDAFVGALVAVVLFGGAALSWQAYQRRRAVDQTMGSMMGSSMGSMHGTDPLWYVLGTLTVAIVVGGGYLLVREDLSAPDATRRVGSADGGTERTAPVDSPAGPPVDQPDHQPPGPDAGTAEANPQERILDLLPDDERRVLEPVLDSPGITQIALRDRSDFSKSKVSQTVGELEERGLLYRERQGRTYRVFPSDDLRE